MFFSNAEVKTFCQAFSQDKIPDNCVTIEGHWDSFVEQAYINTLNTQIGKYENEVNIYFQHAKVGIIFMLLLKDILEQHGIKDVRIYTDDSGIAALSSFLLSSKYNFYINQIHFESSNEDLINLSTYKITKKNNIFINFFEVLGKWCYEFYNSAIAFFNFMGILIHFFMLSCLNPKNFRLKSLFYHMYEDGFKALPVGLVTALIIGYAITLQGAYQLNSMGVPIMAVDTTAKLALREMGPFILALVIAGRSASSFTAQLGSMRLTEEISAMQAMNLNLFYFLIIPRILALVIVMPLMVFAQDAISLFGGMVAIKTSINIGFEAYLERFYETVFIIHFWIGFVKAPVFGAIIGIVGCFRGLECKGDTQSIGRMTTISVVNAIFWIIVANAIFSFIFTRFGI